MCLAASATVAPGAPPPRTSYERGDLDEVRRWGAAATPDELIGRLAAADRVEVLAAIAAAPASPDGAALLPALATLAGGWDRSLAAPAARAARAIARGLDGDRAIRDDLDDDALAAAADAWAALAARRDRWSDVRALAIEIAADLTAARAATADAPPDRWIHLAAHFGDPDPEIRLAALERVDIPAPEALRAPLVDRLVADRDPRVRLVAAQALCAADPRAAVAALGEPGREALYAVIAAPTDRTGALLDAARCLAADDDPRAARAFTQLRQRAPRVLRAPLAALWRRR